MTQSGEQTQEHQRFLLRVQLVDNMSLLASDTEGNSDQLIEDEDILREIDACLEIPDTQTATTSEVYRKSDQLFTTSLFDSSCNSDLNKSYPLPIDKEGLPRSQESFRDNTLGNSSMMGQKREMFTQNSCVERVGHQSIATNFIAPQHPQNQPGDIIPSHFACTASRVCDQSVRLCNTGISPIQTLVRQRSYSSLNRGVDINNIKPVPIVDLTCEPLQEFMTHNQPKNVSSQSQELTDRWNTNGRDLLDRLGKESSASKEQNEAVGNSNIGMPSLQISTIVSSCEPQLPTLEADKVGGREAIANETIDLTGEEHVINEVRLSPRKEENSKTSHLSRPVYLKEIPLVDNFSSKRAGAIAQPSSTDLHKIEMQPASAEKSALKRISRLKLSPQKLQSIRKFVLANKSRRRKRKKAANDLGPTKSKLEADTVHTVVIRSDDSDDENQCQKEEHSLEMCVDTVHSVQPDVNEKVDLIIIDLSPNSLSSETNPMVTCLSSEDSHKVENTSDCSNNSYGSPPLLESQVEQSPNSLVLENNVSLSPHHLELAVPMLLQTDEHLSTGGSVEIVKDSTCQNLTSHLCPVISLCKTIDSTNLSDKDDVAVTSECMTVTQSGDHQTMETSHAEASPVETSSGTTIRKEPTGCNDSLKPQLYTSERLHFENCAELADPSSLQDEPASEHLETEPAVKQSVHSQNVWQNEFDSFDTDKEGSFIMSNESSDELDEGPDFLHIGKICSKPSRDIPLNSKDAPAFSLDSILQERQASEAIEAEIKMMQEDLFDGLQKGGVEGLEEAERKKNDITLSVEHLKTLEKFEMEKCQIVEKHPEEKILHDKRSCCLFKETLMPLSCGFTPTTNSKLDQQIALLQPATLVDFLCSGIIPLASTSMSCKEALLRWMFLFMSANSNRVLVQKCQEQLLEVLQWQMEEINCSGSGHTWTPSIMDVLRVFVNWGANPGNLAFDHHACGIDLTREEMVLENEENAELGIGGIISTTNIQAVLQILSSCLQSRPNYTTSELTQLLLMVCKISLDSSLSNDCLLYWMQVCVTSILDCYGASQWYSVVPALCHELQKLTCHHHNQLYLANLFTYTERGRYLQQRFAYLVLHSALALGHDQLLSNEQLNNFQLQDVLLLVPQLKTLVKSDLYCLFSLIRMLEICVGPPNLRRTQRKQLHDLIETLHGVVADMRDNVRMMDLTKVKDLLIGICSKWELTLKSTNVCQRSIFSYYSNQAVPSEMKIERVKTSQFAEDQEDACSSDDEIMDNVRDEFAKHEVSFQQLGSSDSDAVGDDAPDNSNDAVGDDKPNSDESNSAKVQVESQIKKESLNGTEVQNQTNALFLDHLDEVQNQTSTLHPHQFEDVQIHTNALLPDCLDEVQNKTNSLLPGHLDEVQNKTNVLLPDQLDEVQNKTSALLPNQLDEVQNQTNPLFPDHLDKVQNQTNPLLPDQLDEVQNQAKTVQDQMDTAQDPASPVLHVQLDKVQNHTGNVFQDHLDELKNHTGTLPQDQLDKIKNHTNKVPKDQLDTIQNYKSTVPQDRLDETQNQTNTFLQAHLDKTHKESRIEVMNVSNHLFSVENPSVEQRETSQLSTKSDFQINQEVSPMDVGAGYDSDILELDLDGEDLSKM